MLKEIFDILMGNMITGSVPGISLLLAGGIIGGFVLNFLFKQRFEDYEVRIKTLEGTIKAKEEEITSLKTKTLENKGISNEYKSKLNQYSDSELGKEAQKRARNLEGLAKTVKEKQNTDRLANVEKELHLQQVWFSEGRQMLMIKHEILKRLPPDAVDCLDRLPKAYYESSTPDADLILEAVSEIRDLGLKLSSL